MNHDYTEPIHPFFNEPSVWDTSFDSQKSTAKQRDLHGKEPTPDRRVLERFSTSPVQKLSANDEPIATNHAMSSAAHVSDVTRDFKEALIRQPLVEKCGGHRVKRRRLDVQPSNDADGREDKGLQTIDSTGVIVNAKVVHSSREDGVSDTRLDTPDPRKILKLNKKGTLGSPIAEHTQTTPKKRARLKKSCIAKLRYDTVGERIENILAGTDRYLLPNLVKNKVVELPKELQKVTHPFFTGTTSKKRSNKPAITIPTSPILKTSPDRRSAACTPGKIRKQVEQIRALRNVTQHVRPSHDLPKAARSHIGSHAPFAVQHIRDVTQNGMLAPGSTSFPEKKLKAAERRVENEENILSQYIKLYHTTTRKSDNIRADGFRDPDPCLRLPKKNFLSGPQIAESLHGRLSLQNLRDYPALDKIWKALPIHLSNHDNGQGEPLLWAHKHAPRNAEEVLQVGSEVSILKQWLRTLIVQSVVTSSDVKSRPCQEARPRKKKSRRDNELDDFIVSDDDDVPQLLPFVKVRATTPLCQNQQLPSEVRGWNNNDSGKVVRTANAILISGPHGCGKTAMIYAVAKELNFQVFELSSGQRRSGRDVLERIGDVLGNHIVSHGRQESPSVVTDDDSLSAAEALQKDLETGRQGTMNSFFKTQPEKETVRHRKNQAEKRKSAAMISTTTATVIPKPQKSQKQSIILLEEADILFEEDKSFWTTVVSLMANSKRPFIITCTDEALIPRDDLDLHAILRIPAPSDMVTKDYILLMAAMEGHLLNPQAVEALYKMTNRDLRASICEVQFWCQMGIGDPRGGLDWIFQRWPPGKGLDTDGNVQRVISEASYVKGQGWLSHEDFGTEEQLYEEIKAEAWSEWQLDPRDDLHLSLATIQRHNGSDEGRNTTLLDLREFCRQIEILSDLDHFGSISCPNLHTRSSRFAPLGSDITSTILDPTLPALPRKIRASYTEAAKLLYAEPIIDHAGLTQRMVNTSCSFLSHLQSPLFTDDGLEISLQNTIMSQPRHSFAVAHDAITFYAAIDALSEPCTAAVSSSQTSTSTQPTGVGSYTSLVAPLPIITLDVAPYVRTILRADQDSRNAALRLQEAFSIPTSQETNTNVSIDSVVNNVPGVTKMRKTRAARGALEGKDRQGVRRDKWWEGIELNFEDVMRTGPGYVFDEVKQK